MRPHKGFHGKREAPYHFVPVQPDATIHAAPTFHDGRNDGERRHSGELRIRLRACTPLLVGNEQVPLSRSGLAERLAQEFKVDSFHANKTILEPLAVPGSKKDPWNTAPERVLLAGSSLKGMLRQSLQSLLSAPMERVWERTFSYRPLSQLATGQNLSKVFLAGQVLSSKIPGTVRVRLVPTTQLTYLKETELGTELLRQLDAHAVSGQPLSVSRLPIRAPEGLQEKTVLRCGQGIDGQGVLGRPTHTELNGPESEQPAPGIPFVLIDPMVSEQGQDIITITSDLVEQYLATLDHLAGVRHGHLAGHPRAKGAVDSDGMPDTVETVDRHGIRRNILSQKNPIPQPGEVLFLEFEQVDPSGGRGRPQRGKLLSFGRHFRYRWKYTDSTTKSAGELRTVLAPTATERKLEASGAPKGLSGGRLMFGYVGPQTSEQDSGAQPFTTGIGKGDFATLAGRLSFNFASEVIGNRTPAQRFLAMDRGGFVPLRVLSSPRASAIEFYLDQERASQRTDGGSLLTYGEYKDDPARAELRGRKFYLHQPDAANDPSIYEFHPSTSDEHKLFRSDQCSMARFVSAPGTEFLCTLRFRDLRSWELGALLFVLFPNKERIKTLVGQLKPAFQDMVSNWSEAWYTHANGPLFAHKIGHGRPLGLGSIHLDLEEWLSLTRSKGGSTQLAEFSAELVESEFVRHLEAFATKLGELRGESQPLWAKQVLRPWLEVHRFAGRTHYQYPQLPNSSHVYEYHTQLRNEHLQGRRYKKGHSEAHPENVGLKNIEDYGQ